MSGLIRTVRFPISDTRDEPRTVGWREDAISDQECRHCWGTGRQLRYGRSYNCERGIHATCTGHQDPHRCGCYCHG